MNRPDIANIEAIIARNRAAKAATWGKQPAAVELPPITLKPKKPFNCKGGCPPKQTCDYCAGLKGPDKAPKRKNKFGAVKSSEGDSKKEVRRLQELRLLQAAGQIQSLIPQVRYELIPAVRKLDGTVERAMTYTCDAQYVEGGKLVVEDCKSDPTRKLPAYIHKRKLLKQLFDIEIREV